MVPLGWTFTANSVPRSTTSWPGVCTTKPQRAALRNGRVIPLAALAKKHRSQCFLRKLRNRLLVRPRPREQIGSGSRDSQSGSPTHCTKPLATPPTHAWRRQHLPCASRTQQLGCVYGRVLSEQRLHLSLLQVALARLRVSAQQVERA
jgi:hypothetical protein